MSRKIVVIGGVAAGATAAAKARRTDENADITLLEKGKHISFANCGLPYYTGGVIESRNDILLHTERTFRSRFNTNVQANTEAVKIDTKNKIVFTTGKKGDAEIPYDKLVLAVGAKTIIPPIKGLDSVTWFGMRTVEDADSVKKFIKNNNPKKAVVVGGGFIGIETAEAMMHCGIETSIVEAAPEIMPPFPRVISQNLKDHIEAKGLKVFTGEFAMEVKEEDGKTKVILKSGKVLETDILFICTGVKPNIDLASEIGVEIGEFGGILTNNKMETNIPNVYAAGDVVEKTNMITGKKMLLPLAGPANREGRTAGFNACGGEMTFPGVIGTSIVGFEGFSAGGTGLTYERALQAGFDADFIYTEDVDTSGYYPGHTYIFLQTVFEKKTGKLLGVFGSGEKGVDKRLDVAATAIYAGLTVYDLEHLEFAYAPQFAAAKDNLNLAGFVASNKIRGIGNIINPEDFFEVQKKGLNLQVIDVRTVVEFENGHLDGAKNLYINDIRKHLDQLDMSEPVYLYCAVGFRGYQAVRILRNLGYEAYNISGGIEAMKRVKRTI